MQAASAAHAGPASAVVLLRSTYRPQHSIEDQARDELRLMDIQVDEVSAPRDETEIEQIISEHGAIAAIRLDPVGGAYDAVAWFHNDPEGREMTAQRYSGLAGERALVALRVAEAVRHRVIELQSASALIDPGAPVAEPVFLPPPPAIAEPFSSPQGNRVEAQSSALVWGAPDELDVSAPAAPKAQIQAHPKKARDLSLGVSAAIAGGPGGAQSVLGGQLTLGWRVVPMLTVQAELGALASPVSVTVSHGSLQLGLASAQLFCALGLPGERRIMPQLRVGGGPVVAWALGQGSRQSGDSVALGVTAAVTGGVGLAIRVRPRLHVSVALDLQTFTRAVAAGLYGVKEIHLGPPLVRGTLGLSWTFSGRRGRAEKK